MNGCGHRHNGVQPRHPQQHNPHDQPCIGNVKDCHQRLRPGRKAAPAHEPPTMQSPASDQQEAGRTRIGPDCPGDKPCVQHPKRDTIQPAMLERRYLRPTFDQPIPRERRDDPACDDGNQDQGSDQPYPPSQPGGHIGVHRLDMHQQVGQTEQANRRHRRQVTPVARGNDLPRRDERQGHWKCHIAGDRHPCRHPGRDQTHHAAQSPKPQQPPEPPARHRWPTCPIGNCGEQESRHGSHREPKQHLMHMPRDRREPCWQNNVSLEHAHP